MSKTSNSQLKLLSLKKEEQNLEKHPSMKTFFNQIKEKKEFEKNNNNNINIMEIVEDEDEEINNNNDIKKNNNIKINIIECEYKLKDDKETFFVEANNNKSVIYNIYKNKINNKALNYELTKNQKKLDEKITKEINEGKEYNIIEKNFVGLLKK